MFPYAGQNIAASFVYGPGATYQDVKEVLTNQTQGWFSEYKRATPDAIKSYHLPADPYVPFNVKLILIP